MSLCVVADKAIVGYFNTIVSSLRKALNIIINIFIKLFNVENLKKVPKLLLWLRDLFFYNWYFCQLLYALNDLNTLSVCSACAVI